MLAMSGKEEREALLLLARGDEEAFRKIYFAYSKRLLGNLIKLTKSEIIARELLQEVFIRVWNSRQRIDPDQSFRSFLFKIAENQVYDFFRRLSRDSRLRMELVRKMKELPEQAEDLLYAKENMAILQQALNNLPRQRKRVFQLCKLEGISYEEASRRLGISTSTISDHIVKANHFIRRYLIENQ
jgi:RNA polymerase sigma-70 factor (ECF subfamily)